MTVACLQSLLSVAQSDTILLNQVRIEGSRSDIFLTGKNLLVFDSSTTSLSQASDLGELLSSNSSIFIKSYGAGSSSLLSSRGTEARHSSVLWNGFNLNAAGLGLTDLSVIPVSIAGDVTLIRGGSSPVNGNASIGSTVLLSRPDPIFEKSNKLNIGAESGSYGHTYLSVQSQLATERSSFSTSVFHNQAKNNFTFTNTAHRNHPEQKLKHAATSSYGIVQYSDFKAGKKGVFSTSLWYQSTHREIPPMMTVTESKAEQRDSVMRLHAGYKFIHGKSLLNLQAGYFREHQQYDDSFYSIHSKYFVSSTFADAEFRHHTGNKITISAGATGNIASASFEEYQGRKQRNLLSVYSALVWNPVTDWTMNFSIRSEFSNITDPPLCPSIGIDGNIYKNMISVLINAGRHYSVPSMNDLYWQPGGNEELLPEDALSIEAGLLFFRNHGKLPEISITGFRSEVDNWIRWLPGAGGVYTPENISVVESKGLEASLKQRKYYNNWKYELRFDYTWSSSETINSDEPFSESIIGKQLMYSPEHMAAGVLTAGYRSFSIGVSHQYTGERYTTSDESSFLESYQLTDINFSWNSNFKKHNWIIYAKVYNLFDTSYQVMAWRPAPGRWYSVGLKLYLNLKRYQN